MQSRDRRQTLLAGSLLVLLAFSGTAAEAAFGPPKEREWTIRDFRFASGEITPELRLHYLMLGNPPVTHISTWCAHSIGW